MSTLLGRITWGGETSREGIPYRTCCTAFFVGIDFSGQGGNDMLIAASDPARGDSWLTLIIAVTAIILMLMAVYLTVRSMMTKPEGLADAPYHIRRASSILKWIAIFFPIIMVIHGIEDFIMDAITLSGPNFSVDLLFVFTRSLGVPTAGLFGSLFVMCCIGMIFFRHRN